MNMHFKDGLKRESGIWSNWKVSLILTALRPTTRFTAAASRNVVVAEGKAASSRPHVASLGRYLGAVQGSEAGERKPPSLIKFYRESPAKWVNMTPPGDDAHQRVM